MGLPTRSVKVKMASEDVARSLESFVQNIGEKNGVVPLGNHSQSMSMDPKEKHKMGDKPTPDMWERIPAMSDEVPKHLTMEGSSLSSLLQSPVPSTMAKQAPAEKKQLTTKAKTDLNDLASNVAANASSTLSQVVQNANIRLESYTEEEQFMRTFYPVSDLLKKLQFKIYGQLAHFPEELFGRVVVKEGVTTDSDTQRYLDTVYAQSYFQCGDKIVKGLKAFSQHPHPQYLDDHDFEENEMVPSPTHLDAYVEEYHRKHGTYFPPLNYRKPAKWKLVAESSAQYDQICRISETHQVYWVRYADVLLSMGAIQHPSECTLFPDCDYAISPNHLYNSVISCLNTVEQGTVADCWAVANLYALAQRNALLPLLRVCDMTTDYYEILINYYGEPRWVRTNSKIPCIILPNDEDDDDEEEEEEDNENPEKNAASKPTDKKKLASSVMSSAFMACGGGGAESKKKKKGSANGTASVKFDANGQPLPARQKYCYKPLFSMHGKALWLALIERMMAILYDGYPNLSGNNCGQLPDFFSFDPSCGKTLSGNHFKHNFQNLKSLDARYSENYFVTGTCPDVPLDSGLVPSHCYTGLRAFELKINDGADVIRLVVLRNPWGSDVYRSRRVGAPSKPNEKADGFFAALKTLEAGDLKTQKALSSLGSSSVGLSGSDEIDALLKEIGTSGREYTEVALESIRESIEEANKGKMNNKGKMKNYQGKKQQNGDKKEVTRKKGDFRYAFNGVFFIEWEEMCRYFSQISKVKLTHPSVFMFLAVSGVAEVLNMKGECDQDELNEKRGPFKPKDSGKKDSSPAVPSVKK